MAVHSLLRVKAALAGCERERAAGGGKELLKAADARKAQSAVERCLMLVRVNEIDPRVPTL